MIKELHEQGYSIDEIARKLLDAQMVNDMSEARLRIMVVLRNPQGDLIVKRPDPIETAHRIDEEEEK